MIIAGCYAPTFTPGSPCGEDDYCPGNLVCVQQVCVDRVPADVPPADGALEAGLDGSIDAPTDAPIDARPCPSDYLPLAGQPHHYKIGLAAAAWNDARDACDAGGGYLAIIDQSAEAVAIVEATGENTWMGITDQVLEGTFVTVRGAAPPFLDWDEGEPDNDTLESPDGQDCGQIIFSAGLFDDDYCVESKPYVCECDPP